MIEKLDLRENVEIIPIKGSCHDYCLAKSSVLIKINELVDAVNELQHDNSEKANCQENVLTMVDNQVTANLPNIDVGELAFLSKENTELKDEIDRLENELDRTHKALDAALDKLKRIQKIYTNAPFNAPINYANVCTDMYDVATEQTKELDNE